ncbi:hypothetical protein IJ596_07365, partial [bacterium]|nr:hypothetical protein [bacterium]
NLKKVIDIPIIIVLLVFGLSILYCFVKYVSTNGNLKKIYRLLSGYTSNDLNFKLDELDSGMLGNPYVAPIWAEFKNTLVYSESVAFKDAEGYQYTDVSSSIRNVQTTSDPLYFFNEETLITTRFNYKLIQTMPTILTGCGPLFTFLKIAVAFGMIDFSTQEKTITSVSSFMTSMQSAALVSVVAVASSLIYLSLERIMYNNMCKSMLMKIQLKVSELFSSVSAEQFLYELLRESKISNNSSENVVGTIPVKMKEAFNDSVSVNLVPYLENLIYGVNQLNKEIKAVSKNRTGSEDVDSLF